MQINDGSTITRFPMIRHTTVTIYNEGSKLRLVYEHKRTGEEKNYYIHPTRAFGLVMNTKDRA